MATITGRHVLNGVQIVEVGSDPSAGGGTVAPIGSVALVTNGSTYTKSGSGDTAWTQLATGGGGLTGSGSSGALAFWSGTSALTEDPTKLFWDNTNDRLGVGTASPSAGVHVSSAVNATAQAKATNTSATGFAYTTVENNSAHQLYMQMGGASATGTTFGIANASLAALTVSGASAMAIGTQASVPLSLATNNIQRLYVSSTGNMWSGTSTAAGTSPAAVHHLVGGAETIDTRWTNSSTGHTASDGLQIGVSNSDSSAFIWQYENSSMRFATNNAEQMRIASAGAVSIGANAASVASTYSLRMSVAGSSAKTSASNENIVFFGSSEVGGSFPLGLDIRTRGGATTAARQIHLQATEIGASANDILLNPDGGNVGVKVAAGTAPVAALTVNAVVALAETTAPSGSSGYGQIYVKSSDSNLYFKNDGGTETQLSGVTGGITGSGTTNRVAYWSGSSALTSDADFTFDGTTMVVQALTANPTTDHRVLIDGGSLSADKSALKITGTIPTTAGEQYGNLLRMTPSAGSNNSPYAMRVELAAGYNGNEENYAGGFVNFTTSSTSTGALSGNYAANTGFFAASVGTSAAGDNVGAFSYVSGSSTKNVGFVAHATSELASALNIGGFFRARNTLGTAIAGYFSTDHINTAPSVGTSAVLIADSGDQAVPIFLGKDAGATVLTIADNGNVAIGTSGAPDGVLHIGGTANLIVQQATVNTTNASQTVLQIISTTTNTSMLVESRIVARRTGGSAGSAGDTASYIRRFVVKNVAGTVTINALTNEFTYEDNSALDVNVDASGTSARVLVTGDIDNNISWTVTSTINRL
jgi:hypothetical protein